MKLRRKAAATAAAVRKTKNEKRAMARKKACDAAAWEAATATPTTPTTPVSPPARKKSPRLSRRQIRRRRRRRRRNNHRGIGKWRGRCGRGGRGRRGNVSRGDRRRCRHEKAEEALRHLRSTLSGGGDSGASEPVRKWFEPALLFHISCSYICVGRATPWILTPRLPSLFVNRISSGVGV